MLELTDIGTIKALLARHGFHFSKALGQNFIVNPSVCPRMADESGIDSESGVIEIAQASECSPPSLQSGQKGGLHRA